MRRALGAGLVPYVVMLAGIPAFNHPTVVLGLPELGAWILVWVVLTPGFLMVAYRLLPEAERDPGEWDAAGRGAREPDGAGPPPGDGPPRAAGQPGGAA